MRGLVNSLGGLNMVNTRKFEGRSFIMYVHVLVYTAGLMHFMLGLCWVIFC